MSVDTKMTHIQEAYTDSNRTEYNLKDVEIKNPDYQVQIRKG